MYSTTIIALLLTASYVVAIPVPLDYEIKEKHKPTTDKEKENDGKIKEGVEEAHRQTLAMQKVLNDNPNDPRITTAFGKNHDIKKIKDTVDTLASGKIKVYSANTDKADSKVNSGSANGFVPVKEKSPEVKMGSMRLGSTFMNNNKDQRAGTIIHEATHQLAKTGDQHKEDGTIIRAGRPTGSAVGKGYTDNLDPISKTDPDKSLGSDYTKLRDKSSTMHDNADSYRVFASLCSRSLYRRALLEDDPVGYYLAKRSSCKLPPNYFANKAAQNKAAAAKGMTAAKDTTATKGTTKAGSTKNGLNKATVANGKLAGSKGATTKGKAGMTNAATTKGVKVPKAGKGGLTKAPKGALKAGKGTAAGAAGKTTKGAAATKGLKGAKVGKGVKAPSAGKGVKATKAGSATRGAKSPKAPTARKGVKATKAGATMRGTKSLKTPKAAKGMKVTGSGKSKLAKGTTSKVGKVAKVASKAGKVGKVAKAGKGAVKAGSRGANVAKAGRVTGKATPKAGKVAKAGRSAVKAAPKAGKAAKFGKAAAKAAPKAAKMAKFASKAAPKGGKGAILAKAAVKVAAAGSKKKSKNSRRDLSMESTLDQLD